MNREEPDLRLTPEDVRAGIAAKARLAFEFALSDLPSEAYLMLHGLPRDDLTRLARAAALVRQAAQDELDARPPGPRLLVPVDDRGNPAEVIHVIAPTLRRFEDWCRSHGIRPHARNVHRVTGPDGLRGTGDAWYAFLGAPAGLSYARNRDFMSTLAMLQQDPGFRNAEEA